MCVDVWVQDVEFGSMGKVMGLGLSLGPIGFGV